jgi:hypothetical protein
LAERQYPEELCLKSAQHIVNVIQNTNGAGHRPYQICDEETKRKFWEISEAVRMEAERERAALRMESATLTDACGRAEAPAEPPAESAKEPIPPPLPSPPSVPQGQNGPTGPTSPQGPKAEPVRWTWPTK